MKVNSPVSPISCSDSSLSAEVVGSAVVVVVVVVEGVSSRRRLATRNGRRDVNGEVVEDDVEDGEGVVVVPEKK